VFIFIIALLCRQQLAIEQYLRWWLGTRLPNYYHYLGHVKNIDDDDDEILF